MDAKRRELTDDVKYENGEISLREFIMAIMQSDITRIDSVAAVNARRLEDITNAEVRRLEGVIQAQVDKLDLNIEAVKEVIETQQEMNKERLDSHNRFREQIESERRDLVRKDDLARVEDLIGVKFDAIAEKTEAALKSTQAALKESENRLLQSFATRDASIKEIKEEQDKLDGKWQALTIALAIITIGFTGVSFLLYMFAR